MTFVKRNKDAILSIYSMQQFLSHTVLFQTVFHYFHLIFVDGSSHLEVFWKKSAPQILIFLRIIQCFVLKSLCFVFWGGRVGWGGCWGTQQGYDLSSRSSSRLFYVFLAFCHDYLLCDTLSIGCWPALIPNFSFSLCLVTLEI